MEVPIMDKPVEQRTRERLDANHLTPRQRKQIRIQGVIEYINSKYAGCPISQTELMRAAGFNTVGNYGPDYWNGYNFIKSLRKKGIIIKDNEPSTKKSSWQVPEKPNFKRPMLQAKVQVVTREPDEEVPDKPYRLATDKAGKVSGADNYGFEVTFSKRFESGEHGRFRVGQLEMADVTRETARQMINQLLDNLS